VTSPISFRGRGCRFAVSVIIVGIFDLETRRMLFSSYAPQNGASLSSACSGSASRTILSASSSPQAGSLSGRKTHRIDRRWVIIGGWLGYA
jgi:hypothetical protein